MPDAFTELAKATIEAYLRAGKKIKPPHPLPKGMEEKAGVFVSLHRGDQLRGCIGTFAPTTDNIAEEIIEMAIAAATQDPRFPSVRESELGLLDISVDVLSPPENITDKTQLDPKIYGVIVSRGFRRGLLLPDLEGVDTAEDQIDIAKQKAGIFDDGPVSLQRFKVVRHH